MTTVAIPERDFRFAMGSFATGVCVLSATREDGAAIGMTVNSFSSVSLDPPLILVCLGAEAPRSQAIIAAGRFAISVLGDDQAALSNHFARPGEGLAADGDWTAGANGAPLINNASATIECELDTTHLSGDHQIVIGRVTKVFSDPERQPLLYYRGGYHQMGEKA